MNQNFTKKSKARILNAQRNSEHKIPEITGYPKEFDVNIGLTRREPRRRREGGGRRRGGGQGRGGGETEGKSGRR